MRLGFCLGALLKMLSALRFIVDIHVLLGNMNVGMHWNLLHAEQLESLTGRASCLYLLDSAISVSIQYILVAFIHSNEGFELIFQAADLSQASLNL